jgi:hypothetical protein
MLPVNFYSLDLHNVVQSSWIFEWTLELRVQYRPDHVYHLIFFFLGRSSLRQLSSPGGCSLLSIYLPREERGQITKRC